MIYKIIYEGELNRAYKCDVCVPLRATIVGSHKSSAEGYLK